MSDALLETERVTLLDLLDRVLETGVVIDGDIDLAVADINLVHLGLKLVLASSATLEQHSDGGVTHFADPIDIPPIGWLAECFSGSTIGPAIRPGPSRECVPSGTGRCGGAHGLQVTTDENRLSRIEPARAPSLPKRVGRSNFDPAKIEHGLAKLALTLIELLRRLMEKQAIRKMALGTLTEMQVEGLGEAFRRLENRMEELKRVFGLQDEDLNLDLGPLGNLM